MEDSNTILIVDDEPIGRETLKMMLRPQGYHIATASNGEEALEQTRVLVPDLVLLDIMMPGMDGYTVCKKLRADPHLAEVPVILVTALDDRDSRLQGIEAGADDFVSKPFDRVELRVRVQSILRLNRYRRLLSERSHRHLAEEDSRRRTRELTLLNRVIAAAASALDVKELLSTVCEALAQTMELPQITAALLENDQSPQLEALHYVAPADSDPASPPVWRAYAETMPVIGVAAIEMMRTSRAPIMLDQQPCAQSLYHLRDLAHQHNIFALLIVPILTRHQVAGFLEIQTPKPRMFAAHDLALVQSVATAVGQAMETAQLHRQLQQHADKLEETVAQRTRELELERDQTQAMLEALGDAVVVTDGNNTIHYMNPAAVELTGFSTEEAIGQSSQLWASIHQSAEFYAKIRAAVRAGQTWRGEIINQRKDGRLYDAALTVAPLFDVHDREQPVGFVSVQRDITPLKEAERLKDQFVSNVSHELRTPLSIITMLSGNLDTLYHRLDDERRHKMICDIRVHTRVLDELIGDVLEIARIDSHRVPAERGLVDLAQIMHEEAEKQLPLARGKQQTLRVVPAEPLMVWGNNGQLRQVVRNLVNNAIKYTQRAGEIICECQQVDRPQTPPAWQGTDDLPAGPWAMARVIDTGKGISPDHLPHIFERFYRVESQGNISGTGLGLSIARELIALHNGYIAAVSTQGQGSTFTIYLPLARED